LESVRPRNNMDIKGEPKKDLEDELESLREEMAHLQSLIQAPVKKSLQREDSNNVPAAETDAFAFGYIENAPLGMAVATRPFHIEKANATFCRMLGYAPEETASLSIEALAQDPDTCIQLLQQIFEKVQPVSKTETKFLKKTGESFWIQFTASLISEDREGGHYALIVIEDIGDRIGTEHALQAQKRLLESLINSSLDGIVAFDSDGFFTVWNPAMERIFGVSAKETLGKLAFQACPFLVELGEDVNFAAALKGEKVISRDKSYTIPGSTTPAYFEGYYGPMYNPIGGEVIGGLAIIRDVTERTLAEEEKRISEERYRELFENAYDMVYTYDLTGKITSINKAAERILGYTRAEALEMRFHQFVAPEFQQIARRMMDRQIADQAPVTQELEIIAKNSNRITLEVSNRLIFREGKAVGIQGIARDITERKKTEEALQKANVNLESWVRELEQRTREMTLLSEMGDILRACITKEEIYEVIVRTSQEIFPSQGGALYVIGPLRNIVEQVAEWGEKTRSKPTFTPDECWALRRGRVHWVEDTNVGLLCKHLSSPPPKGYLCVPMMAQSEAVGVLHLTQLEDSPMPEAKQRLAVAMAEHVAMALSNLRLNETLRNQSIRDSLTGLFNRSFMEESLELELRRSSRTQSPVGVIMFSLDNFQTINEKYGSHVGDSLLRGAGIALQSNIRKGDIASRFSEHTYVVVLPSGNEGITRQRAETICDLARRLEIKREDEHLGYSTASVALAVFPEHGQTVETLLRAAETALNRAKSSGGDCVAVVG